MRFVAGRIVLAVPTLVLVTFLVFLLMEFSPADPSVALAGDNATPERIEEIRAMLGLDQSFFARYSEWALNALQGDLGISPTTQQPVLEALLQRLPVTLSLVLLATVFSIVFGVVFGTLAALNKGRFLDWSVNALVNLMMAVPPFVAGLLLVLLLAITVRAFPAVGYAELGDGVGPWLRHATLPAISLAVIPMALLTRQVRSALIDAMEEDYIRTARAKGLRRLQVVGKHAAKNAALPGITVMGLMIASMLSGAVVVERIFAIPGLGSLGVTAVLSGDVVLLQGLVVVVAIAVTVVNVSVDASYGYFNPKLRSR